MKRSTVGFDRGARDISYIRISRYMTMQRMEFESRRSSQALKEEKKVESGEMKMDFPQCRN